MAALILYSSFGRCAQHLRRIRGCDARIRRESGAYVTQMLRAKIASYKCGAHLPRNNGCYFWTPLYLDAFPQKLVNPSVPWRISSKVSDVPWAGRSPVSHVDINHLEIWILRGDIHLSHEYRAPKIESMNLYLIGKEPSRGRQFALLPPEIRQLCPVFDATPVRCP
jgi:hypothetical protein